MSHTFLPPLLLGVLGLCCRESRGATSQNKFALQIPAQNREREREIDWLLMVRCADGHCYSATQDGLYGCDANACEPPHQRGNSRGTSAKGGRTWELKVPHPHAPFSSICFRPLGLKHESEGRASLHQINPNHVVHWYTMIGCILILSDTIDLLYSCIYWYIGHIAIHSISYNDWLYIDLLLICYCTRHHKKGACEILSAPQVLDLADPLLNLQKLDDPKAVTELGNGARP